MAKPHVLCILDGWGFNQSAHGNAIKAAATPNYDWLKEHHLIATLDACGTSVGLPKGQMGNSEVGHLTIGAGRTILQDFSRIDTGLHEGALAHKDQLNQTLKNTQNLHLFCLLSPGGIHSHQDHLYKILDHLKDFKTHVWIHVITDGRDTPPQSALAYVHRLQTYLKGTVNHQIATNKIATISGRFYTMDRDQRWDRLQESLNAFLKNPTSKSFKDAGHYVEETYAAGVTDEFIPPAFAQEYPGLKKDDLIFMVNFRSDRVRQLLNALFQKEQPQLNRSQELPLTTKGFGMVDYSTALEPYMIPLFPRPQITKTLGEFLSQNHLRQLRLAETEKFAHVTYFLNGGQEQQFSGEDRTLIPSPKVKTYDLAPEMSAKEITQAATQALLNKHYDVIIMNYANADMVGHTGNFKATRQACSFIDTCLGDLISALKETGGKLFLTADHGNADQMLEEDSDDPRTAHSMHPVPFIIYDTENALSAEKQHLQKQSTPQKEEGATGTLADVAPTILASLGLEIPSEMTGTPLENQ